jgi:hypothetical protein
MITYWVVIAAGVAAESGARNWKIWVSDFDVPLR